MHLKNVKCIFASILKYYLQNYLKNSKQILYKIFYGN